MPGMKRKGLDKKTKGMPVYSRKETADVPVHVIQKIVVHPQSVKLRPLPKSGLSLPYFYPPENKKALRSL